MKELFPKLDIHGGEWYPLCDNTYDYSKSEKEYVTLQECVDEAYNDMLRSKY